MRRPAHEPEPVGATPPGTDPAVTAVVVPAPRAPAVAVADTGPPDPGGPSDDDVRRRATATVRAMVEVLAGRRPPAHLAGVARPEVVRYLTASRTTGRDGPVAPARVHVTRPTRQAAEIVAVCRFGERFRALTVRLDRDPPGSAWCVTAVRLV
ncbi:hypothetical protein EV378_4528 [Pseudonocardia endophytica]|uniref:Alanine, arginine and proline rich protein n=2 Tax=Pseudonocardia endophytica TaxID=401976 RepID=A0A4R1HEM9_PSEEN|nr:hypothetical protein EV378_4528 [Pseudonocardia endophytica]